MRRTSACIVLTFALGAAWGCSPPHSIQDMGAHLAAPLEGEDCTVSTASRAPAVRLLEAHAGDYEILSEDTVVKGSEWQQEYLSAETSAAQYQVYHWRLGVWHGVNAPPPAPLPVAGVSFADKSEERGVIVLPDGTPKQRAAALKLIEKHLGANYVIVWECEKATTAQPSLLPPSSKYFLFYSKPPAPGTAPEWEPGWTTDDTGHYQPCWIRNEGE